MTVHRINDIEGAQSISRFTPENISAYSIDPKQTNKHSIVPTVDNNVVKQSVLNFLDILDTLGERITHSGLDEALVAPVIEEITECRTGISNLDQLDTQGLSQLYCQLAAIAKGKSATITLLKEYSDNDEAVNSIQSKAALISGIVSQPHRGQ